MKHSTYIDLLAMIGIEDAHPGGFELTKQLISVLPISKTTKVLEVGCGSGKTLAYLYKKTSCSLSAIEINDIMISKASKRFWSENIPVTLVKGNVEQIPFPNSNFDMIISESVTVFTKIELSLREYIRVLKKNGIFTAIEMTIEQNLDAKAQEEIVNVYGIDKLLTEFEWINVLNKNGFKNVSIIGGTTIKNTTPSFVPPSKLNKLNRNLQKKLFEHQKIIQKYNDVLGYRIFVCEK